jgi:hypothetical protein
MALLWREWRQEWVFLLAAVAALIVFGVTGDPFRYTAELFSTRATWALPLVRFSALALGLMLGVRAYAPGRADGTDRLIRALPVSDELVFLIKVGVRVPAIVGGMAIALALGGHGAGVLMLAANMIACCLVGVLAGQLLDQSATAFAAGAAACVVATQAKMALLASTARAGLVAQDACLLGFYCVLVAAILLMSLWVAKQR